MVIFCFDTEIAIYIDHELQVKSLFLMTNIREWTFLFSWYMINVQVKNWPGMFLAGFQLAVYHWALNTTLWLCHTILNKIGWIFFILSLNVTNGIYQAKWIKSVKLNFHFSSCIYRVSQKKRARKSTDKFGAV